MSAPSSVLLLHGWQNRREADHWQSRVAAMLRERDTEVAHPQLPDPDEPDPDAWAATARAALDEMTPGHRVVVCHSLGCLLWARIAEPVDRVCWVAPPGPDELRAYTAITAFLPDRLDAEALRASSTTAPLRLVCSDDDPYCAAGAGAAYGEPLGLDTEVLPGQAHINPDSGYGDWP
ncbi:MAG TPA: alpha/beta hydrolase, partial [Thermoleophilaceae bacterium]|nr:alpha/beta hydrolase [Thermoleophilaceae bacterium]